MQLRGKMTPEDAKQQGEVDAEEALKVCVKSLEGSMKQLNTKPPFAKVSSAYHLFRVYCM
jgi:hypothetical protein